MIIIDEDFSFENEYDMIIPLSFIRRGDAAPEIHCCREIFDFVSEIADKYKTLTEKEFFIEADAYLRPFARSHGFSVFDEDTDDYYFSYILDSFDINSERKYDTSQKIQDTCFENLTGYDIISYIDDGLTVYGTVIDGKIVSAAAENLFDVDYDDGVEISVETAQEYRRRGYGASNALALSAEIISRGKKVYYVTSHKNTASVKLAESIGFRLDSVFFSYCCYK